MFGSHSSGSGERLDKGKISLLLRVFSKKTRVLMRGGSALRCVCKLRFDSVSWDVSAKHKCFLAVMFRHSCHFRAVKRDEEKLAAFVAAFFCSVAAERCTFLFSGVSLSRTRQETDCQGEWCH